MEDQILNEPGFEAYKFGGGMTVGFLEEYLFGKVRQKKQERLLEELRAVDELSDTTEAMVVRQGRALGAEDQVIEEVIDGEVMDYETFDEIDREVWEEHDGMLEKAVFGAESTFYHVESALHGTALSFVYDVFEDFDGSDDFQDLEDYGTAVAGYMTGRAMARSFTDRDPMEIS